ncbi:MAG: ankyrin repeat domain-containing protein [Candidatus Accumulibacter sp.]|jgi:ankyrin repeat protein|nr:ankyrin repeat domain-containing protein [Accumulibacter sp.]
MKKILFVLACLAQTCAFAGTYEEMEAAMSKRDSEKAIGLVRRGMDVNTVDRAGDTLLIQAVRQDMPELVDFLLESRARLNSRNRFGETALTIAAFNGNIRDVKRLVEAGAEVNHYGWPPLVYAALNGHADLIEYLLKSGAQIDAQAESGATALYAAARGGHLEAVKKLLDNKANPEIANQYKETPLDIARKMGHVEIEKILQGAGK